MPDWLPERMRERVGTSSASAYASCSWRESEAETKGERDVVTVGLGARTCQRPRDLGTHDVVIPRFDRELGVLVIAQLESHAAADVEPEVPAAACAEDIGDGI